MYPIKSLSSFSVFFIFLDAIASQEETHVIWSVSNFKIKPMILRIDLELNLKVDLEMVGPGPELVNMERKIMLAYICDSEDRFYLQHNSMMIFGQKNVGNLHYVVWIG